MSLPEVPLLPRGLSTAAHDAIRRELGQVVGAKSCLTQRHRNSVPSCGQAVHNLANELAHHEYRSGLCRSLPASHVLEPDSAGYHWCGTRLRFLAIASPPTRSANSSAWETRTGPAHVGDTRGQETAQDPRGLPPLSRGHPPRAANRERGVDHWRASYIERCPRGSAEGRAEKDRLQAGTSPRDPSGSDSGYQVRSYRGWSWPSKTVPHKGISEMWSGPTAYGSSSSTVKSAFLPVAMLPR